MTHRRKFFAQLSAGLAALASPRVLEANLANVGGTPDESWLQGLNGKHRQFFDVNALNDGQPLGRVANFLDVYRDSYGIPETQLNAIFGAHGNGLGFVLSDYLWDRFELGQKYAIVDKATGKPARKNLWAQGTGHTVASLQSRGVRFLACRQTVSRVSRELAAAGRGAEDQIKTAIELAILPHVTLVPAMVVAGNRAQEVGLAYTFVG